MKTVLKQKIEKSIKIHPTNKWIKTLHGIRYYSNEDLKEGQINCNCGVGFVIVEQDYSDIVHYKCVSCGRFSTSE